MSNLASSDHQNGFEIAIIGMSGRFPRAKDIGELWRNLRDGVESISFFSDEELASSDVPATLLSDPDYVKARGVLEEAELFDGSFFGFTPREAELMDPQHRLFLECAWEALENAGYDAEEYKGSIGVYAGASMNTYLLHNLSSNLDRIGLGAGLQTKIGIDKDYLTTRVSYNLNLDGPSVVVQTTCSTSLVAVHLACQSLLGGECDMALAGGASISVPQKAGYLYQEGGIYSPDGHCRAFDARAQGTVSGNGVGIVVLKRLEDALTDGDCIYAVIKGSAINNDGSSKVSYTAPSVDGQAKVITRALAMADIDPETVSYVEAFGTGTALGDPIEIAALTRAFRASTDKKGFCAIGSVKTNVGHLNAAAGVTGLIKTTLALKHKMIPPSLHFERPNPQIDLANSPFYVNTALSDWQAGGHPRRAGVHSFGIGGTNAHAVLEEAPPCEASGPSRPWQVLVLSGKTPSALETATANLAEHLKQHPEVNLADVGYTLQIGRRAFSHRRMLVCHDLKDAVTALETLDPQRVFTDVQESRDKPVVFMFPGQGAQYVNMASELYQVEPTFREQVDLCSEHLKAHLGLDLREALYPIPEQAEVASQQLQQAWITHLALFAIEYALGKLWMAWGIHPEAMIGHGIGEYVAACLADVLSLEDALALVAARGRLMQPLPGGAMLAVHLPEKEVQPLLDRKLSLASIDGPSLCTVSGPTSAVDALQDRLTEQGVSCVRVHTPHAFHSEMVEPLLERFTEQVKAVTLESPKIPYVSNVTGTWITAAEATSPRYWARQLRQPVRFAAGLHELLQEPDRILLEVGPGQTLSSLARQHPEKATRQVVLSTSRHPQDQESDMAFLLNTLGQLWLAGIKVDWSGFYARERRHRVPLPTYPFERRRYWVEPRKREYDGDTPQGSLRKERDIADWFYIPSWERLEDTKNPTKVSMFSDYRNPTLQHTYIPPTNELAQIIADVWRGVIGVDQLGIDDNFFELGGNSLLLVQVYSRLQKLFKKDLSMADLIKYPTIHALTEYLIQKRTHLGQQPEEASEPFPVGIYRGSSGADSIGHPIGRYIPSRYHPYLKNQYHRMKKSPLYGYLRSKYIKNSKKITERLFSYTPTQLDYKLKTMGITEGDTILMHSGFKFLNGFNGTPDQVIECILNIIGHSGNLLMVSMPYRGSTYKYLKEGIPFDVNNTMSAMGIITETFRRRPGVVRSLNPAHPILAYGPAAEWIIADHEKTMYSCGKGSPFEKILRLNAKALF